MTTRRKGPIIALLAALAIVALSLPGWAANPTTKIYGISVTPTSGVASGTSVVFTVTLTNVSPGNSSFNSFQLSSPTNPGAFVITQAYSALGIATRTLRRSSSAQSSTLR